MLTLCNIPCPGSHTPCHLSWVRSQCSLSWWKAVVSNCDSINHLSWTHINNMWDYHFFFMTTFCAVNIVVNPKERKNCQLHSDCSKDCYLAPLKSTEHRGWRLWIQLCEVNWMWIKAFLGSPQPIKYVELSSVGYRQLQALVYDILPPARKRCLECARSTCLRHPSSNRYHNWLRHGSPKQSAKFIGARLAVR